MRLTQTLESRLPAIIAYAVFAPLAVSGTLAIWRDSIPHATVVLALVVVIVGADAAENAARLEVLVATARSVADHRESELIVREVEEQLTALLDLDRATWVPNAPGPGAAVLRRDGAIVQAGVARAGGRGGFPTDTAVSLPVGRAGQVLGRIDLVASAHVSRPSAASLRMAFLLADQLAAAWSREQGPRSNESAPHPDLV